ncbi:MAG: SPFH domain-containing protein [Planctomycetia bacterium]|nr:SPFH domain-containing protein [Planctomycetia bacterium]
MSNSEFENLPGGKSSGTSSSGGGKSGGWRGLVMASAGLSTVTAIVLLVYGLRIYGSGSMLMTVMGIQFALIAVTSFLVLHAGKLRDKLAEVRAWKRPEWGNNVENPYEIEFDQAKVIHFLLLGILPTVALGGFALYALLKWTFPVENLRLVPEGQTVLIAILAMTCSIVWLVMARSFDAIATEEQGTSRELPEASSMMEAAWEACWSMAFWAGVMLLRSFLTWPETALCIFFLGWILFVSVEQLCRLFSGWMTTKATQETFRSPTEVFLRYMVFVRGNPIKSFFFTMEQKWGVSFRSSWSIRFVARAMVPAIVMVFLMAWGLSSLYVVRLDEFGVRKDCGKICHEIMEPGIHLKLPYPFGTVMSYPVKKISMLPIGYERTTASEYSYIWTKEHGTEFEIPLNQEESFVVNAMVQYKIKEDPEGFFNYVKKCQNPNDVVSEFAYRALVDATMGRSMEYVMSVDRAEFANELATRLQNQLDREEIGIQVLEVSLLNLHPPVAAAKNYLEVLSAEIRQDSALYQARESGICLQYDAEVQAALGIAQAKVNGIAKVQAARSETAGVLSAYETYKVNPDCYRFQYWLDNAESVLADKRLVLVDESIEVFLDTQKNPGTSGTSRAVLNNAR